MLLRTFVLRVASYGLIALLLFGLRAPAAPAYAAGAAGTGDSRVDRLIEIGLIQEDANGRYRLDQPITRAEMARVLCGLLNLEPASAARENEGAGAYRDVPSNAWYAGYVRAIAQKQAMRGYADDTFRPGGHVTGAETATMLVVAVGALTDFEKANLAWPDTGIKKARFLGLFEGIPEDIRLAEPMKRRWVFDMICNARSVLGRGQSAKPTPVALLDRYRLEDSQATFDPNAHPAWAAVLKETLLRTKDGVYRIPADRFVRVLRFDGEQTRISYDGYGGWVKTGILSAVSSLNPGRIVLSIPYISQLYPTNAPVGCEGAALLMALKSQGYAGGVDLKAFLDAMPKHSSNPALGFVGSPYQPDEKLRTTIYPAILSRHAAGYGRVKDLSGATPEELRREIANGNPVVVYATLYWHRPYYRSYLVEEQPQSLLRNNHAVTVIGYDEAKRLYWIADPYNREHLTKPLLYPIAAATFERIYDERRWAVAVYKTAEAIDARPALLTVRTGSTEYRVEGLVAGAETWIPVQALFRQAGVPAEWVGSRSCRLFESVVLDSRLEMEGDSYVPVGDWVAELGWTIESAIIQEPAEAEDTGG